MKKVLAGENNPYFGILIDTDSIGLGVVLDRFTTGYLLTFQFTILQLIIAVHK